MTDQNPIHRDRGRRDEGEQPYTDARETFAENEAMIERNAPFPGEGEQGLTEEEQRKLEEEAAEDRFEQIGEEKAGRNSAKQGDDNGN